MSARSVLVSLVLSTLAGACGPAEANGADEANGATAGGDPPRDPDVVFLVDDVEIRASEVDMLADVVGELSPEFSGSHRRRVAIGGTLLPRAALAARYAKPRREARAACRRQLDALRVDPGADTDSHHDVSGNFHALGVDLYAFARALSPGEWSEPFEQRGSFLLVRLTAIEKGPEPQADVLTLDLVAFSYLPPGSDELTIEEAIDAATLTILDDAWTELVPERYKYRMGGRPDEAEGKR